MAEVRKTMCFTLQAANFNLKRLFRKKDSVEAILKESGHTVNSASLTIFYAFSFFNVNDSQFVIKQFSPDNHDSCPVVKIYLSLTDNQVSEVLASLDKLKFVLASEESAIGDITFYALEVALDYALERKSKFNAFLKTGFRPAKNIAKLCLICSDDAETLYCDAAVCLKCKHFFHDIMRSKTILTLKCSKNGNCFTTKYCDISCRKCRYERCRIANMVEQYCFTELPELVVRSCLVCRKSEDSNRVVLGYSLCSDCRLGFDDLLTQKSDPECFNEPECRCATFECPKCLKNKLEEYGFFRAFKTKYFGSAKVPNSCYTPDNCCVCQEDMIHFEVDDKEIMDIIVCLKCRSFLKASLDSENHLDYCCPRGEVGRICQLRDTRRCHYCWLYRLEVEGLVERWQICSGNPSKWFDIIKSIDTVDEDEGDFEDDKSD